MLIQQKQANDSIMSLLRTLWGGGDQEEGEKKSSEPKEGEEGTGGGEEARQPAASWVKGFGGMLH